jgi:protein SCO1/2
MIRRAAPVVLVLLLALATPVRAGVTPAELKNVSAEPLPGAALPLDLAFTDQAGRVRRLGEALEAQPTVLIFADYTCRTLCGPILDFAANALRQTGLRPGSDFRFVVIGLDPRDGFDAARTMRAERIGTDDDPLTRAAVFLSGREPEIDAATAALGYHYVYDAAHDQYAHPAAAYVLDARGNVTRVLSGLGLSGSDMRLALVAAGQGHVGTLGDRIRLLCYGYDPVRGIYTERITVLLEIAAGVTVAALGAAILLMNAVVRRRASS